MGQELAGLFESSMEAPETEGNDSADQEATNNLEEIDCFEIYRG